MDKLDSMQLFTRVVELRSFTQAAQALNLKRSTVTDAIKQLESRLNIRLLQRTTRHVSATLDGEAYYQRCLRILADVEDAEMAFAGAQPKGFIAGGCTRFDGAAFSAARPGGFSGAVSRH